jgi:hypothetical protein
MRLIWSIGGQLYALNVMGVVNAGALAITQALTNTIGTAIKTTFTSTSFDDQLHESVALQNIGLRDIRTPNQPEFIDTGAAVPGSDPGDVLPLQVAFCITLRTALAGASWRGRVYLPGFAEVFNTDTGNVASAGGAVNFVSGIKSNLISNGLDLGVISRPNDTVDPPKLGWITTVTSIVARDLVWDTQRRRAIPGI